MKEFHRRSVRLKNYDYAWSGAYFVTICIHSREHLFGKIPGEHIQLSEIGSMAERCWYEIPKHYPDVELGAFIVMPNHIHGIIIITSRGVQLNALKTSRGVQLNTQHASVKSKVRTDNYFSTISPTRQSLGSIVRSYKAAVTSWCKHHGYHEFRWQRSYFDYIIRNPASFDRISNYILTNPQRWNLDKENKNHSGTDDFDNWLDSL